MKKLFLSLLIICSFSNANTSFSQNETNKNEGKGSAEAKIYSLLYTTDIINKFIDNRFKPDAHPEVRLVFYLGTGYMLGHLTGRSESVFQEIGNYMKSSGQEVTPEVIDLQSGFQKTYHQLGFDFYAVDHFVLDSEKIPLLKKNLKLYSDYLLKILAHFNMQDLRNCIPTNSCK
jgi:hypothetical protein